VGLIIFLTFTLYGTRDLNPIFSAETIGYTAKKAAGMVMRRAVWHDGSTMIFSRARTRAAAVTSGRWSRTVLSSWDLPIVGDVGA